MDDNEMRKRLWDAGYRQYGSGKEPGSERWANPTQARAGAKKDLTKLPLREAYRELLARNHNNGSFEGRRTSKEEFRWGGWTINFPIGQFEYSAPNVLNHRNVNNYRVDVGDLSCALAVVDHAVKLSQRNWGQDNCVGDFIRMLDDLFQLRETMLRVHREDKLVDLRPVLVELERQAKADMAAEELAKEDVDYLELERNARIRSGRMAPNTPWPGSMPNAQNIPFKGQGPNGS